MANKFYNVELIGMPHRLQVSMKQWTATACMLAQAQHNPSHCYALDLKLFNMPCYLASANIVHAVALAHSSACRYKIVLDAGKGSSGQEKAVVHDQP